MSKAVGGGDTVLVTGASGFVGSAIANLCRDSGFRVRVMVRETSPRTNIHPDDDLVVGDLTERGGLYEAMRGVRYLFHAAADYRLWAADPDELIATNVEGTRNVMAEALRSTSALTVHLGCFCRRQAADGAVGRHGSSNLDSAA